MCAASGRAVLHRLPVVGPLHAPLDAPPTRGTRLVRPVTGGVRIGGFSLTVGHAFYPAGWRGSPRAAESRRLRRASPFQRRFSAESATLGAAGRRAGRQAGRARPIGAAGATNSARIRLISDGCLSPRERPGHPTLPEARIFAPEPEGNPVTSTDRARVERWRAAAVPARSRSIEVDGHQFTVHSLKSTSPSPDAPTYLLVHGIGASHRYYRRVQRSLAAIGHTHSLDLPGFGGTRRPVRPLAVEEYGALLGRLLDRLEVPRAVLVGHSMGAQFVTEVARQRPDAVSHLVLIGPVTDPRRSTAVQQALGLTRDVAKESPSGNLIVFRDYLECGPRWFSTELVPMLGYRTDLALGEVHSPILVIRGTNDPVSGSTWCASLAAAAPDGHVFEVAGHRHLVHHSAAVQTAAIIEGHALRLPSVAHPAQ
ncbi:alpha/beta fold hydrolase [Cryobacterium sp. Hz7]|nr:alpha/beta fold hydrolase [Cryobacterium sp. Hz7]